MSDIRWVWLARGAIADSDRPTDWDIAGLGRVQRRGWWTGPRTVKPGMMGLLDLGHWLMAGERGSIEQHALLPWAKGERILTNGCHDTKGRAVGRDAAVVTMKKALC